jgi:thymidylate synthase (FAD)
MAGRTCYKSEDKITETSAKEFVDRMIKSGHGAMLEHGTVYLFANWYENEGGSPLGKYKNNKYSRYTWNDNGAYVTTNLRVLVENGWMDDLKYLSIPTEYHARRITVKFVCDRGVTHEFVRHRVFSFAQESTRYCNYSKDKFGSEITCILPPWIDANDPNLNAGHSYCEDDWGNLLTEYYYKVTDKGVADGITVNSTRTYLVALEHSEKLYFSLLTSGWKAQEARAVLPTAVKAELVMTGFVDDWKHFFHLRTAAGAHPQARELAQPLQDEFVKRNYID